MNETTMTIVGNVLNEPECRRLEESQQVVTHFKVAATSRRYDRGEQRWTDGDALRLRVTCWRHLAANVFHSVRVGDPVIVTGRLSSKVWEGEDHVKRTTYELEAHTVGHDLTRGRARFARVKPATATSTIDDAIAETRIAGQVSTPIAEVNDLPRRRDYDSDLEGFVTTVEHLTRDPFAEDVMRQLDEAVSAAFDTATEPASGVSSPFLDPALLGAETPADAAEAEEEEVEVSPESDADEAKSSGVNDVSAVERRKRTRGSRVPVGV